MCGIGRWYTHQLPRDNIWWQVPTRNHLHWSTLWVGGRHYCESETLHVTKKKTVAEERVARHVGYRHHATLIFFFCSHNNDSTEKRRITTAMYRLPYDQSSNRTFSFPVLRSDNNIDERSECNVFSWIELCKGLLQVPSREEYKKFTAFVTAFVTPSDMTVGSFERGPS